MGLIRKGKPINLPMAGLLVGHQNTILKHSKHNPEFEALILQSNSKPKNMIKALVSQDFVPIVEQLCCYRLRKEGRQR